MKEKELVVEDCEDEYIESSTAAVGRLLFQLKIQRKSCTIMASSTRAPEPSGSYSASEYS